jgi:hypothetical protein
VNANGAAAGPPHWCFELDSPVIDSDLSENFEFQPSERRCTFVAADKIWAMKFPTTATYEAFQQKYQDCLFENTFKMEADDVNRAKVMGAAWNTQSRGSQALIFRSFIEQLH